MLKRGSGVRHLPLFPNSQHNMHPENNNMLPINVLETLENSSPVRATPSPIHHHTTHHTIVRSVSPALVARSVRHIHGTAKQTANIQNTNKPRRPSAIGKQAIQTLKVNRHRRNRSRPTRRH